MLWDPGKVYEGCSIVAKRRPAAPLLDEPNNPATGCVVDVEAEAFPKPFIGVDWILDPKMLTPVVGAAPPVVGAAAFPNSEPV